jgi:hypothetical protein
MSLPGNRLPAESVPPGSTTPAEDAEVPPIYCRHSTSWTWVPEEGGYLCDDPEHYFGPPATSAGALPLAHQPPFANPPNEAQQRALRTEEIMAERDVAIARVEGMRRRW